MIIIRKIRTAVRPGSTFYFFVCRRLSFLQGWCFESYIHQLVIQTSYDLKTSIAYSVFFYQRRGIRCWCSTQNPSDFGCSWLPSTTTQTTPCRTPPTGLSQTLCTPMEKKHCLQPIHSSTHLNLWRFINILNGGVAGEGGEETNRWRGGSHLQRSTSATESVWFCR